MMLLVWSGNNPIHIVSYKAKAYYTTWCNKKVDKHNENLIAVDNTCNGICMECKNNFDNEYSHMLKNKVRCIRGNSKNYDPYIIQYKRENASGPLGKFADLIDKHWYKLSLYKRLTNRKKNERV